MVLITFGSTIFGQAIMNNKYYARLNVLDTAAAAHVLGLSAVTIRGAILRGEFPAWKPDGSKVWLMFRDDVEAWRASRRKYQRD